MTIQITGCQILRCVELPAREPYPPTHLVTLFQEETGEVINVVASEDCFGALQATERTAMVMIELQARQVDLAALGASRGGKAYKLRVTGVLPEEVKG